MTTPPTFADGMEAAAATCKEAAGKIKRPFRCERDRVEWTLAMTLAYRIFAAAAPPSLYTSDTSPLAADAVERDEHGNPDAI